MKKVKTVQDLGEDILLQLKTDHLYQADLLEYAITAPQREKIYNNEFDLVGDLRYGANEGIYLDIYIQGDYSANPGEFVKRRVLTFKTLRVDNEALYDMAKLQASCMIVFNSYMRENASAYERRGYKCVRQKDGVKGKAAIFCESEEKAKMYKKQGYAVTELLTGEDL